jgi:ketosteroid isomerase-like protein
VRSTGEVINDHLEQGKHGSLEEDLPRNYAEDVTVVIADGLYQGHDGVRALAERLRSELPHAAFQYTTVVVHGDVAFLEWTGEGDGARVRDGVDTFVVRDGKIVAQTIHYTVEPTEDVR